jgi:hypothetical protein
VGINKASKDRLRGYWMEWAAQSISKGKSLPSPTRERVMTWIKAAWDEITDEMIFNAYRRFGYNPVVYL